MLLCMSRLSATCIRGAVLMVLWRWFIAAPFSIMPITLAHALGLSVLIQLLTFHATWKDVEACEGYEKQNIVVSVCHSVASLMCAFLVSLFM